MTSFACPPQRSRPLDEAPAPEAVRVGLLWPEARRMAARRCRDNLYRLARGDGGFYDADDFWQDLFIEFWGLLQRPELANATWDDEALRTAWGKALYGGGLRILRRAPQRLWQRFSRGIERPVDPAQLDPTGSATVGMADGRESDLTTTASLAAANLAGDDGPAAQEALARVADLAMRLAALRPTQRQALYMAAVQGLSAREIAARLGLSSPAAVSQRLRTARRELASPPEPADG